MTIKNKYIINDILIVIIYFVILPQAIFVPEFPPG